VDIVCVWVVFPTDSEQLCSASSVIQWSKISLNLLKLSKFLVDSWNRVVVEFSEMQPDNLGFGYYSLRLWVANNNTVYQAYFGNYNTFTYNFSNIDIQICSSQTNVTNAIYLEENQVPATFDMMNFNLFVGGQRLYSNASGNFEVRKFCVIRMLDTICTLTGFLSLNQRTCFFCQIPYFYDLNSQCVSSCPENTFPHAETRSCQSKSQFFSYSH
jgi:ferredoxin